MRQVVVADAGPLIALARTGHLSLLSRLFEEVLIPEAVKEELQLSSDKPGARVLRKAIAPRGWIKGKKVRVEQQTVSALGPGEREAILLASRERALLLIDDRKGRRVAGAAGVRIIGTGRILLAAKEKGFLEQISPVLTALADAGYRLSGPMVQRLRELAKEC